MRDVAQISLVAILALLASFGPSRTSTATTSTATTSTTTGTTTSDLLVGDSVMAGMGPTARSVLPNHVFDAEVCRRLVAPSCSYRGVRPITALEVVRARAGSTDRAIVVAAGYNDGSIADAVDAVVAEARRQGVPHVVWLTYRVAGSNAAVYRSHNAVLAQKARQHPELDLADWAGHSAGRSDWVAADGLHLNGAGASAMADLVAAVLADLRTPLPPGASSCFAVSGEPGDAVIVNLTPVQARGRGHGVLTSSAVDRSPTVSNVNYALGTVDPNLGLAPVGSDRRVCYRNGETAAVHLVADHLATLAERWFTPAASDGLPRRVLDTRPSATPIGPDERRCFAVAGRPGDLAVVNLTPVRASDTGHGVLVASDVDAPANASNVNFAAGTLDPNVALAPIGPDGAVCFANADRAGTHLVADHLGTIDAAVVTLPTGAGIPRRAVDTRSAAPIGPGGRRCFAVEGGPGDVAVVNLTPVRATAVGHGVLVGGDVDERVPASNVNYAPGTVDPNLGLAAIGADGDVCFQNAALATVHLVADHMATIDAAAIALAGPTRRLDTRQR